MKIQSMAKRGAACIWNHKVMVAELAFMALPAVCMASNMPWDSGITSLKENLTGPTPKMACVIAIAVGGSLYAFGQSDIARFGMKAAFGTAIATGAASLSGLFGGGDASACVFF